MGVYMLLSAFCYFVYTHPTSIEQNGMRMGKLTELFYPIIDKLSISLTYAWIIYSCHHGYSRKFRCF